MTGGREANWALPASLTFLSVGLRAAGATDRKISKHKLSLRGGMSDWPHRHSSVWSGPTASPPMQQVECYVGFFLSWFWKEKKSRRRSADVWVFSLGAVLTPTPQSTCMNTEQRSQVVSRFTIRILRVCTKADMGSLSDPVQPLNSRGYDWFKFWFKSVFEL